jgi:hypothetical protein
VGSSGEVCLQVDTNTPLIRQLNVPPDSAILILQLPYTDHWGAYTRHLDPEVHSPGKRNTQKIERKHLTLRARIKRLVRKTICFSKSTQMHDIVLGLFVNRFAFGRPV